MNTTTFCLQDLFEDVKTCVLLQNLTTTF